MTGVLEGAAGVGDAAAGLAELEEHLGLLRVAEVEAVGDAERPRAGAGDVARRLRDRGLAALVRVERHQPGVAVHRDGDAEVGRPAPGSTPASPPGPSTVEAWTRGIVLLVHPALARDVGAVEQELQARRRRSTFGGTAGRRSAGARRVGFTRLGSVDRTVVHQALAGNRGHGEPVVLDPEDPVVGHPADGRGGELPLGADRLDLLHPPGLGHHQHPLLRFGEQDLVRRHPGFARRHQSGVDLDADAAARRHLGARAGETGGAHVLDGDDQTRGDQLQAGLEQQLLGERVAHLDLRPACLALLGQLLGGEAGAVDAVASGARADREEHVADAVRPRRGSARPRAAVRRTSRSPAGCRCSPARTRPRRRASARRRSCRSLRRRAPRRRTGTGSADDPAARSAGC